MQRKVEQSLRSKEAPAALAATPKVADPVALATATSTVVKDEQEHLHQATLIEYLITNMKPELHTYTRTK